MHRKKKAVLYYGSRKSDKFVRCYKKREVGGYRVELELHSGLLHRHGISVLNDLGRVPNLVCPKHLQFVDFNWAGLVRHLETKTGEESHRILAGARRRRMSILRLQRYLRRKGVLNPHRFLVPRAMNETVRHALDKWTRMFNNEAL